jgi:hypothetical protein
VKYTLPTDSNERKDVQLLAAFLRYIPAAAVRFAKHSKAGNDKHNPGEPIHHARGKSSDHQECILRHLMDLQDLDAAIMRRELAFDVHQNPEDAALLEAKFYEATAMFWRAGVYLQELCEIHEGAPLAPGARLPKEPFNTL